MPLFAGVFGIFGHGNVLGLGTALYEARDELPTWRGQTEEGMALAAVAYAKATDRRQVMAATSSIGPGALNMVTAAGLAHANRLPVLLLPGDAFTGRGPDPVLQQVEHFGDPTTSVNDAFRAVSRYFDRITRPEQLLATLPQVARVLTDPADAGPVVLALPQDVQAEEYDFPAAMFAERLHRVPRARPDVAALAEAEQILRSARRPLIVAGGGARYSGAGGELLALAEAHGVPVVETPAGRTLVPHDHALHGGPLGIIGSTSANTLAHDADVVLAVGTRLQDFTTSSWTAFAADVRVVALNVARFDAVKHGAHALVGDARVTLAELDAALAGWQAEERWSARAAIERGAVGRAGRPAAPRHRSRRIADLRAGRRRGQRRHRAGRLRAHVVRRLPGGAARRVAVRPRGVPRRWTSSTASRAWATRSRGRGGRRWLGRSAHPDGLVTGLLGDGSYLMLNSDLYSAAFAGHPFVLVVCDNGGYAVIHRLQTGQGAPGFNNLLSDARGPGAPEPAQGGLRVDLAAHARALGATAHEVAPGGTVQDLPAAYLAAREAAVATRRPAVVVCHTHPATWTEAGAWWEVGVPAALSGRAAYEERKASQQRWLA